MNGRHRRRPRVVVVGSYAVGLVMRTEHIPLVGETTLGRDFQSMDGGKGSNQAVACARLGADTTFLAAVGDDTYGAAGLAMLKANGVDVSRVRRVSGVPTGVGFILIDREGANAIAVDLGANLYLSKADIDAAEDVIASADILLTQLEIDPAIALYAAQIARRHNVRVILNPAPAQPLPPGALTDVHIMTPNLSEAQVMSGQSAPSDDYDILAQALHRAGAQTVILTLGERGARIVSDGLAETIPAFPVQAIDTTGAGDGFSAALAVALGLGASLRDAVLYACAAGAYSVQALGTVPSYATAEQLADFLKQHGANH